MVVLDTDFLSAFLKIDRLKVIRQFFAVDSLILPVAVYREIASSSLVSDLAQRTWIEVREVEAESLDWLQVAADQMNLGQGEREAIALAHSEAAILLMNDNKARALAREASLSTLGVPDFLLACKDSRFLQPSEIKRLVEALEEKDHYGFRAEVRELLLSPPEP